VNVGRLMGRIAWSLVAAAHAVPALVAVSPSRASELYGTLSTPTLDVLLQHRAMVFVAVAAVSVRAAVNPDDSSLATWVAGPSMVGFVVAWLWGGRPPELSTVAAVDVGLLALLGATAIVRHREQES
jgi:hypothetical protein